MPRTIHHCRRQCDVLAGRGERSRSAVFRLNPATSLEFATCSLAAFYDDRLTGLFDLDERHESP